MGDICSVPEVNVTDEQLEQVAELVQNSDKFKALYDAVPILCADYNAKKDCQNDIDKLHKTFMEEKGFISGFDREKLGDYDYSVVKAVEEIVEKVSPLAESMLGGTLKEQLPADVPDSIKDKAVSKAIEVSVEQAVSQAVKKMIKDKDDPNRAPGGGGGGGGGGGALAGGGVVKVAASPGGAAASSPSAASSSADEAALQALRQRYQTTDPQRLAEIDRKMQSGAKAGDILRDELLFVLQLQLQPAAPPPAPAPMAAPQHQQPVAVQQQQQHQDPAAAAAVRPFSSLSDDELLGGPTVMTPATAVTPVAGGGVPAPSNQPQMQMQMQQQQPAAGAMMMAPAAAPAGGPGTGACAGASAGGTLTTLASVEEAHMAGWRDIMTSEGMQFGEMIRRKMVWREALDVDWAQQCRASAPQRAEHQRMGNAYGNAYGNAPAAPPAAAAPAPALQPNHDPLLDGPLPAAPAQPAAAAPPPVPPPAADDDFEL